MRSQRTVSTPISSGFDSLKVQVEPNPIFGLTGFPQPLKERVVAALNRMGGAGKGAEEAYQSALDELREAGDEVIRLIGAAYAQLPEEQYLQRWSLVQLLAELKQSSSLDMLDRILSSEMPPERSRQPDGFSSVGEEIIIRTTVVETLARLAAEGNQESLELLFRHVRNVNLSIKRACVQAILAHGGEDARQRLLDILPAEDHPILDMRRMDVREAPPVRGERRPDTRDARDHVPRLREPGSDADEAFVSEGGKVRREDPSDDSLHSSGS